MIITAIKNGKIPILVTTLHYCTDYVEQGTKKLNEMLHDDIGSTSFIYDGPNDFCIRATKGAMYVLIDRMLERYGSAGVISLHRRKPSCRQALPIERNFFELGTLAGQTLDNAIVGMCRERLELYGVVFDHDIQLRGGEEIQLLHQHYNDPGFEVEESTEKSYKIRKTPGYGASKNKVQIAQIEINGAYPFVEENYFSVKVLAECMLKYLNI